MAVCAYQPLIDADPCLLTLNAFELKVVKLSLLCAIKTKLEGGDTPSCDIQTLLTDGACFAALPDYVLDVIETGLLCDISALL